MLIVNKLDKSGKPLNELAKNGNSINKIYRNGEVVFQNVTFTKVTAITLDNLVWTTNIPASGGTATKDNCTYSVTAYYSDGTTSDVTSEATITGSQVIPSTNIGEVHSAGTLTLTASYSGFTATGNVTVYQEACMSYVWVDIRTVNNTTPIYDIGWKTNGSFSGDKWFAELSGLTTDGRGWTSGKSASYGRYTYHRFNSRQYTCNFLPQYDSLGDGYGANGTVMGYSQDYGYGARDVERTTLSTETINGSTYYILGLKNWLDWKPLYVPYSTSTIQSNWSSGLIMVKILA